MQEEKIVVDLDHPVWLSEPGYGNMGTVKAPYCALGKMKVASGLIENLSGLYTLLIEVGIDTRKYWLLKVEAVFLLWRKLKQGL